MLLRNLFFRCILVLSFVVGAGGIFSQTVLFEEDFDSYPDYTDKDPNGKWDGTKSNACHPYSWHFAVVNKRFEVAGASGFQCCTNSGGFRGGDSGNEFITSDIDITGYATISIDFGLDYEFQGNEFDCYYTNKNWGLKKECPVDKETATRLAVPTTCWGGSDMAMFHYSVDGGEWILLGFFCGNNYCYGDRENCGISVNGSSLRLRMLAGTQGANETYILDDIKVTGYKEIKLGEPDDVPNSICRSISSYKLPDDIGGIKGSWSRKITRYRNNTFDPSSFQPGTYTFTFTMDPAYLPDPVCPSEYINLDIRITDTHEK